MQIKNKLVKHFSHSLNDNIIDYISQVYSYPKLSDKEEIKLINQFYNTGDLCSVKQLIRSHLKNVVQISLGYFGYGLTLNDIIQEGSVGLMKAVKHFKPNKNIKLFTYSIHWIKAEIHEYIINNWHIVRIVKNKSQKKIFFNLKSLKNNILLLNENEIKSAAKNLGVNYKDIINIEQNFNSKNY